MRKYPDKVRISFEGATLTHFGGLYLLQAFLRRLTLPRLLAQAIRFRRWNTRYSITDECLALLYPILLGLGRVETTRLLQHNGTFQFLTGLRTYPDPSSLRRFLTRLGTDGIGALQRLHDRLRTAFLRAATVVFDVDSTVLTVYGRQEHAAVGHNPKKRGRPSFHPLLCFEGRSRICWDAEWLPGNAHPVPYAIPVLDRALAKLRRTVRRFFVRADAAFFDQKFIGWIEGKRGWYAIAVKMSDDLEARLEGLRYHRYRSGAQAAAFLYKPRTWAQARRFVVIRRPTPEEPSAQLHLFQLKGYSYQILVTNLPLLPLNVWKFYNGRATAELLIRELKEGYAVGKIPRYDWAANLAHFHLVLLAYNLLTWFKHRYLPKAWRRLNVQTLRHRLLWVPAVLVRPQGIPTLKLPRSYPYREEFLHILRALERRAMRLDSPDRGS